MGQSLEVNFPVHLRDRSFSVLLGVLQITFLSIILPLTHLTSCPRMAMESLTTPQRDLVFVSYSHLDKKWLDWLQILLKPYIREKQISLWMDPYIPVGDRWERKIDEALNRTKIAVLLVSRYFVASDFIANVELPAILSATERGDAVLFCVPISSVPKSPIVMKLSKYQWARGIEEPLGLIPDEEMRNNALVKIVDTLVTAFPLPVAPVSQATERQLDFGHRHVPAVCERTVFDKQIGKLHGVPSQRPHFIPRTEELNRLKEALLTLSTSAVGISGTASKFGLHGQGGIGKSVLAIALANDDEVRRAFPDGIYWVTLGQAPDMLRLLDGLIKDLSGKETDLIGVEPRKKLLKELFEGKCCLLVLDDLWRYEDALAFDVLDPKSKLLITTRDATLLTALGAHEERLDRVNKDLALELLAQWSGQPRATLPNIAEETAEHCNRIPLALALAGARVRDGMGWKELRDALARGHLEFLDHPYGSIFKSMRCSVDALSTDMRQRYLELAIFPEDTVIPESIIHKLWHHTGGLDAIQVKSLLNTFERKGLIYAGEGLHESELTFHDLQQDFLRLIVEDLSNLHAQLLQAYRNNLPIEPRPSQWSQLPSDDRYIWSHLTYHLAEAGHFDEMQALVQDLRYLAKKIFLFKLFSVEGDLAAAERMNNRTMEALRRNLAQSAHMLTGFSQVKDLLRTLYTRLSDDSALVPIANQFESSADISFLKPLWPMPDRPHPALLRIFEGHRRTVTCCAIDPHGKWIVSASHDRTFRMWDVTNGTLLRTMEGHTDAIWCCAIDSLGRRLVAGSRDGILYLWDLETYTHVQLLNADPGSFTCCAFDHTGRWLIAGTSRGMVHIWDTTTAKLRQSFQAHQDSVTCCAFDPHGHWFVTGSEDATVGRWELPTGVSIQTIADAGKVRCCAVDPKGRWLVSGTGLPDIGLRLWDLHTGHALRNLEGHTGWISCCAFDSGGTRIISGSGDHTLRVWDATSGKPICTLQGHTDQVTCCVVDPLNHHLLSGSEDTTVRLWNMAVLNDLPDLQRAHADWVSCCAADPEGNWVVSGSEGGTLQIWDVTTGSLLHAPDSRAASVRCCAVDPGGKWVVYGLDDLLCISGVVKRSGLSRMWDMARRNGLRMLRGHTSTVTCCAVDPGGQWIVSGAADGTLRIWKVSTGELLRTLQEKSVIESCAIEPKGQWVVSATGGGTLSIWDVANGTRINTLRVSSFSGPILCCAIDSKAKWIISGGNALRLWEATTGSPADRFYPLHSFQIYSDARITCCAVHPDEAWLVSGTDDGTLAVWNIETRHSEIVLRIDDALTGCAWMPQQHRIVASGRKGLYLFEIRP